VKNFLLLISHSLTIHLNTSISPADYCDEISILSESNLSISLTQLHFCFLDYLSSEPMIAQVKALKDHKKCQIFYCGSMISMNSAEFCEYASIILLFKNHINSLFIKYAEKQIFDSYPFPSIFFKINQYNPKLFLITYIW